VLPSCRFEERQRDVHSMKSHEVLYMDPQDPLTKYWVARVKRGGESTPRGRVKGKDCRIATQGGYGG
jgi:hypothetical protein